MNTVSLIGRVVKVSKVENKNVYKVRVASNTPGGAIFITAFVYSEDVPAEKGDLVFVAGELRPIGDTGGLYISADKFARLKRAGTREAVEEEAVEETAEEVDEGTGEGTAETGEGEEEITEEDIKNLNF